MRHMEAENFGRHLKAALVLAEMSAARLAAEVSADLGIGQSTIERTMSGRRRPKPWEVAKFAEVLGVPEWFLLRGLDAPEAREATTVEELREQVAALLVTVDRLAARREPPRAGSESG